MFSSKISCLVGGLAEEASATLNLRAGYFRRDNHLRRPIDFEDASIFSESAVYLGVVVRKKLGFIVQYMSLSNI